MLRFARKTLGETSERKERAAVAPLLLLSAFLVFLRFPPLKKVVCTLACPLLFC